MNTFCRYVLELIILCSTLGMANTFYNEGLIICLITSILIVAYYVYRIYYKAYSFDFWGDVTSISKKPNKSIFSSFDTWDYSGYNDNSYNVTYTEYRKFDAEKEVQKEIKVNSNENKIEILETVTKEVVRPMTTKVSPRLITKADKKETKEEKIVINPKEFNKELIMMVNDENVSAEVRKVYDAIIKTMKNKNFATSKICTLLSAFTYVDIIDKNIVIYVNKRQIDETTLESLKTKIVENINEMLSVKCQVMFYDIKYMSVFDYFNKCNQV